MNVKSSYLRTSIMNPFHNDYPQNTQSNKVQIPKSMNIITNLLPQPQKTPNSYLHFSFQDLKQQFITNLNQLEKVQKNNLINKAYLVHKRFNSYQREFKKMNESQSKEIKKGKFEQYYQEIQQGKTAYTITIENILKQKKISASFDMKNNSKFNIKNDKCKKLGFYSNQVQKILLKQPVNIEKEKRRFNFIKQIGFN